MNLRTFHAPGASAALFLASILTLLPLISATAQLSPKWVRFQDGYGKDDVVEDVAVDASGNIYVAAWTRNNSGDADYYVAKYDRYGTRAWYHLYDGGGEDVARSIAVKGSKVVVTGKSRSGAGFGANYDILTFVLDTDGTITPDSANALRFDYNKLGRDDDAVRVLFAPGSGAAGLFVSGIHADSAANDTFYVAGTHRDTLSQSDNLTILMYDNTGNIGGIAPSRRGDEFVAGMEVTSDAIYVGATAVDSTGFGSSYETAKFNLRLGFEWQKIYGNVGDDVLRGLAADASGVYVTGVSRSACGDVDAATIGYAPDGTNLWTNRSFDCASGQVGTGGILVDGGDVLAAGYHANGSQYFRIRKSDGTLVRTGDVWGVQSSWVGFVRSYDGNIYAGGHRLYYDMPAAALHFAKFNSSDALQWDVQFDGSGTGNASTIRKMIASPADSSIILAGSVTVDGQEDMMIVKYGVGESLLTGVGEGDGRDALTNVPDAYGLDQNYPNPFNSSTILRFRLPERVDVTLKIYDMIGREAATLVEGTEGPGEQAVLFSADDLPSGVYVARLTAGRYTEIRKIVLMR
jgi:hypothetical protein